MKRDRSLLALYMFYAVSFMGTGMFSFAPKFYGEIGLTESQIGLISGAAAMLGIVLQPLWGMLADRWRYKRSVIALTLALCGGCCFLVMPASARFVYLLVVLMLYSAFNLPAIPVGNAIAIEYTGQHGFRFGPVRLMGTIGYVVPLMVSGFLFGDSLKGLFPVIGCMTLAAAGLALLLPPVEGHQHSRERVSLGALLKDPAILLLLVLAFLAHISHQFSYSFFSKHLGDLGVSNGVTGIISAVSVMLEIPFLIVADRLSKRFPIWTWLMIGFAAGAVRFFLLSVVTSPLALVLVQMLTITHTACFDFFPFLYLSQHTRLELQASAQSIYNMTTYGGSRIVASLLGGYIAEAAGIPAVFRLCGILMLSTLVIFSIPMLRAQKAGK